MPANIRVSLLDIHLSFWGDLLLAKQATPQPRPIKYMIHRIAHTQTHQNLSGSTLLLLQGEYLLCMRRSNVRTRSGVMMNRM